jgi:hypothetical protein
MSLHLHRNPNSDVHWFRNSDRKPSGLQVCCFFNKLQYSDRRKVVSRCLIRLITPIAMLRSAIAVHDVWSCSDCMVCSLCNCRDCQRFSYSKTACQCDILKASRTQYSAVPCWSALSSLTLSYLDCVIMERRSCRKTVVRSDTQSQVHCFGAPLALDNVQHNVFSTWFLFVSPRITDSRSACCCMGILFTIAISHRVHFSMHHCRCTLLSCHSNIHACHRITITLR